MTGPRPELVLGAVPVVDDIVEVVVSEPLGWGFDQVAEGIARWVLGAVGFFVGGVVDFLVDSATPTVTVAWFAGANSPLSTVRNIAAVLLLVFVFLGLIQGLIAGDVAGMFRRIAFDLPAAVIGMAATTVVVDRLLVLTDALSAMVLQRSGGQAVHFLSGFAVAANGMSSGFAAVLLGLVAIVAGLLVWIELMVRSVLIYVLVALSPLAFAATLWPSARGVLRRTVELLLAVIASKLVIAVAISVGVAALGGSDGGPRGATIVDEEAAGMGRLFVGTAILAMAAFSPFLLLRLMPVAEAAVVAQGLSRAPIRAAQATMSKVYFAQSLTRLGGGHSGRSQSTGLPAPQPGERWALGAGTTAAQTSGHLASGRTGAVGGPAGMAAAGTTAVAAAGARAVQQTTETVTAQPASPPPPPTRPSRETGPDTRRPSGGDQQ